MIKTLISTISNGMIFKNMNPNNRVQRTLHKVSGPLTRDVGATKK